MMEAKAEMASHRGYDGPWDNQPLAAFYLSSKIGA
jgi:hypothetical protein